MEKLITAIETYAASIGKVPEWVLREAIGASWRQWRSWKSGQSSPTVRNADRIYQYMAANPAPCDDAKDRA